jgi:prevent-host-death family protein
MHQLTIQEAATKLPELVQEVLAGEEVVLTQNAKPVAKLVAVTTIQPKRVFGDLQGMVTMTEDFDAPLEDLADYQ